MCVNDTMAPDLLIYDSNCILNTYAHTYIFQRVRRPFYQNVILVITVKQHIVMHLIFPRHRL